MNWLKMEALPSRDDVRFYIKEFGQFFFFAASIIHYGCRVERISVK